MKLRRRIGSVFLAFAMALSLIPSVAVSALAATAEGDNSLVTLEYENDGSAAKYTVNVSVYVDQAEEPVDSFTVTDANRTTNNMLITVNNGVQYEIDRVEFEGATVGAGEEIAPDLRSCSFTCSFADGLYETLDVSVYLRTPLPKPDVPEGVYEGDGSVFFYLYEDQLLKMLHLANPESTITANTEIKSVFLNFTKDVGAGLGASQYKLSWHAVDSNEGIGYYHSYGGISNINNDVVPNNISSLVITYGNGQTATIPAGDLRCVNQEATGIGKYILKANNDTCYAVAFYDSGNTGIGSAGAYSLHAIAFVEPGQTVTQMPEEPEYIGYHFAGWSTAKSGGNPFNESYVVNSDMRVWAQKYSSKYSSSLIYVDNTDNAFLDRFVELCNATHRTNITVDQIKDSVKIQVNGINEEHTNPNYSTSDSQKTGWDNTNYEEYTAYKIYNYDAAPEGTDPGASHYNKHIPFDEIQSITISADVTLNGQTVTVSFDIDKGSEPGEFGAVVAGYEGGTGSIDGVFWLKMNQGEADDPVITPDPGYTITGIDKELVEKEDDLPAGVTQEDGPFMFPNDEGVVVISVGKLGTISNVTLLYKITVTGESGAAFTVTDIGATLVQADGSAAVTQGANDEGFATFSGAIPEGGEAVFYVSKTFSADEITDEGKLVNTAKITSENVDPDGEDEDTEEVNAKEETNTIYAYVQFIGSGAEGALTEEEQEYVTDTFGCTLHGNNNDYVAIGSFDWNIPDPSGSEYAPEEGAYANDKNFFDSLLGDSFVFPEYYTQHEDAGNNFPVDKVDWNKLTTAKGAGQFDEVGVDTVCWHLDGQIQLYAPDISVDKELTKVVRDGNEVPNISTDTVLEVGDELTWTITVTNSGNAEATGLKLEDVLKAGENTIEAGYTIASSSDKDNFSVAAKGEEGDEVIFTATYTVTNADKGLTLKNTATVTNGDDEEEGEGSTENEVANPAVDVTKALTSAKRGESTTTGDDLANYKAQVGDVLTYTITVTNTGNTALTGVEVKDTMWGHLGDSVIVSGMENPDTDVSDEVCTVNVPVDSSVTITYTYTVQDSDVAAGEIKNTAGVYLPDGDEPGEEPDDTDEVIVNMDEDAYTITITPANIEIYTGGNGYNGVTVDENGTPLENPTESGLPEPGYHIELAETVTTWLSEQQQDSTDTVDGATNLADILSFAYSDGTNTRNWDMAYAGIYETDPSGIPTRFVYTLDPATVNGQQIPVRILYFEDTDQDGQYDRGEEKQNDQIDMSVDAVHANYLMTINPGELDQSQIKAVFIVGDKTITCNVNIGTGNLTVKSVVNKDSVNDIANDGNSVDADTPTAVAGNDVQFYVNDSQVTVDSDRVGLLVDSVSNEPSFNEQMETDAISEVREDGISLSDAQTQSYYLDLVDTENGNAVVTMGDDDQLTIYWPMPDDADPSGDFYIVHYTEMDRENTTMQETPTVTKVNATADGNHLTFATSSFSPFVLVYEQKDSGTPTPPVEPDDPTPPPVDPDKPQLNTEDHYAYIVGYEDGTVRPEGDITRAEVATIFFRLLTDESRNEYWSQTNDYTDVAEGDWYNNAVSTLSKAGILNGYEDGSFQPNGNITRAEFATIAARFFEATYEGEDLFPDIKDHWARDYINQAAHAGIVNGYEDGTFRPQENITRAEAMTIVNRTLDRHPDADHFLADMITWPDNLESAWYYEQVQEATNSHEYIMKTDADKNSYEIWKKILPVRDWSDLENTWSEAHAG